MKILLVYPETPATFWSFKEALKFISKRSSEPPLGLVTVAAMLPDHWEQRLIDMNVSQLKDSDIEWADYVFLSGMDIHIRGFKEVIRRSNKLGTKVVAGGPLVTTQYRGILGVDHFILNEAEITLPQFLEDLKNGEPKHLYYTEEFPDITSTPIPKWELLEIDKYSSLSVQYSRGCPYDCEFCSITMLNGRKPRTKTKEQFTGELDRLYQLGWRGAISIVDDNFIGNKRKLKNEILPYIAEWQKERHYPFGFTTEVSVNLADDEDLLHKFVDAGFNHVFVGIETPSEEGLQECGKAQNLKRDLIESVNKMQKAGLVVSAGFIVGFDNDTASIFDDQIDFIQKSGIVSAMVGLLNAPIGTKLFKRLQSENRLLESFTGNNMDGSINFVPKMNYKELIRGYSKIIKTIYSHREFYQRLKKFIENYQLPNWDTSLPDLNRLKAFFRIIWKIGIRESGKKYFWEFFFFSLIKYPKKFPIAMTLSVYGFHFRKVAATI